MRQINPDIFNSLFVFPVTEHVQTATDSLGDSSATYDVSYLGYIYEGFQRVYNSEGVEEMSNRQIYLRGDDAVKIQTTSKISCNSKAQQRIIAKHIYYGRAGAPVIGVLYLP